MGMGNNIWFHADDFGVTKAQSEVILSCHTEGALNSISILPNTFALKESLEMLDNIDSKADNIRRVLHLNFVEGRPLSNPKDVPLLVDETGYFDKSFIKFFKWNYTERGSRRQALKDQLKLEIAAQLRQLTVTYDYRISGIDSHQHYHMIPIIFDSLMEVLSDREFKHPGIKYIRIPTDPVAPIMHNARLLMNVPKINWVKWWILKLYKNRNVKILQEKGIAAPVFFGMFYTCEMKSDVVGALLGEYVSYSENKNRDLELMFHPGNLTSGCELLDKRSRELEEFYMSDNRFYEAQCLKMLGNRAKG